MFILLICDSEILILYFINLKVTSVFLISRRRLRISCTATSGHQGSAVHRKERTGMLLPGEGVEIF